MSAGLKPRVCQHDIEECLSLVFTFVAAERDVSGNESDVFSTSVL